VGLVCGGMEGTESAKTALPEGECVVTMQLPGGGGLEDILFAGLYITVQDGRGVVAFNNIIFGVCLCLCSVRRMCGEVTGKA
jgi:hypothetical protein